MVAAEVVDPLPMNIWVAAEAAAEVIPACGFRWSPAHPSPILLAVLVLGASEVMAEILAERQAVMELVLMDAPRRVVWVAIPVPWVGLEVPAEYLVTAVQNTTVEMDTVSGIRQEAEAVVLAVLGRMETMPSARPEPLLWPEADLVETVGQPETDPHQQQETVEAVAEQDLVRLIEPEAPETEER